MSRHEYNRGRFTVELGWDPCLGTFYAQVYEDHVEPPAIWLGTMPQEFETVEELSDALGRFGPIAKQRQRQLRIDRSEEDSRLIKGSVVSRLLLEFEREPSSPTSTLPRSPNHRPYQPVPRPPRIKPTQVPRSVFRVLLCRCDEQAGRSRSQPVLCNACRRSRPGGRRWH
jgi:hypothetical protein